MRLPFKKKTEAPAGGAAPNEPRDEIEAKLTNVAEVAKEAGHFARPIGTAITSLGKARTAILRVAGSFATRIRGSRVAVAGASRAADAPAGEMQRLATNAILAGIQDETRDGAAKLAHDVVESIRAVKLAIERAEHEYEGPMSMREELSGEELFRDSARLREAQANGMERSLAVLEGYVERGERESEQKWVRALYAWVVDVARGADIKPAIRRGPARAGDVDRERDAARRFLAIVERLKSERKPAEFAAAWRAYALLVDVFGDLVGVSAKMTPTTEYGALVRKMNELVIDPRWTTRYLDPPRGARPTWNPIAQMNGGGR